MRVCPKSDNSQTVKINQMQIEEIKENLTDLVEWSTNKIVDESKPTVIGTGLVEHNKEQTLFANIVKILLSVLFVSIGILLGYYLFSNRLVYWTDVINKIALIAMSIVSIVCIALGISIFKEKDRNYIISMFSAIVSLVALIVSIIK